MTPPQSLGKLVVVGVGLIGGSFALALRERFAAIVGVGRTRANLDAAKGRGAIDRGVTLAHDWTAEARDADVVLLATPVAQYPGLLQALAPHLGARTIVTDAGSTKRDVVAAMRAALATHLEHCVPAHPIAGSEQSGAQAADPGLFRDRHVIVTPLPQTDGRAQALVTSLWQAAGARVSTLTPERHDGLLAAVSHLPHVLAFALVDELAQRDDARELLAHAGSGFRDFTRIAASSPEMWRDIALANRDALGDEIAAYRAVLDRIAAALDRGDGAALEDVFARASAVRKAWGAAAQPARSGDDEA
ncbi:MAG TPA: prephenate dehydrogenase/arogenate dehydrogenase family protein [Casimicrobiaceae bacterium]